MPQPDKMLDTVVSLKWIFSFKSVPSLMFSEIFLPAVLHKVAVVEWRWFWFAFLQFFCGWCTISVDRSWWQKFKYLAVEHFYAITICIWHLFFV